MKYLKYTSFLFLSLLSFCACTQESVVNSISSENITLKLNILDSDSGIRARGTSESPILKESTISNVYIFFFEKDAPDTSKSAYFFKDENLNASGSWSKTLAKSVTRLVDNVDYDVYVLANLPSLSTPLTKELTKGGLLTLEEAFAGSRNIEGADISFSGSALYKCGVDSDIPVDLNRTVARFDIAVNIDSDLGSDWSVQSVEVGNENAETLYFTDVVKNGTSRKSDRGNAWKVGDTDLYRYYAYENESSTEESGQLVLFITIKNTTDNKTRSYKAVVNKSGNSLVQRNYIYKVVLTLKKLTVNASWTIMPFNEVSIDGSIQATYLNLDKSIISVSLYGGMLGIKTDAEKVTLDLSGANDYFLKSHQDSRKVEITPDSNGELSLQFMMNAGNAIINDGQVVISAGNLKKTVTLKKNEGSVVLNHVRASVKGGGELLSGMMLPPDVYKDAHNSREGLLQYTVRRNCDWTCIIYTYREDGIQLDHRTFTYRYNGIPGEQTVDIELIPNEYQEDGTLRVVLDVSYGRGGDLTVPIYTFEFGVEALTD